MLSVHPPQTPPLISPKIGLDLCLLLCNPSLALEICLFAFINVATLLLFAGAVFLFPCVAPQEKFILSAVVLLR
jgi:hypothetical protein